MKQTQESFEAMNLEYENLYNETMNVENIILSGTASYNVL